MSIGAAEIYHKIPVYLLLLGRYSAAEAKAKNAIQAAHHEFGREHLHTLASMSNLASTYSNQGCWKEAEVLEVQVMEASKRVLAKSIQVS